MRIGACKKTYGRRVVLNCPEMFYEPGLIYAVAGPNGSGKSTYAKIAAGVIRPDGNVKVTDGKEVVRYMPQKSFPFRMSVEKNILLFGGDRKRAEMLMEALGLAELKKQSAAVLSGGETAKMALARVLMRPCDLLILDEPAAAMELEAAVRTESLIDEYRRECGCAVLLVTHDLSQARRMADEALFFFRGELREHGKADQVLRHPEKEETRRFLDFYGGRITEG